MTHPIPQPRRIPFIGNVTSIDRAAPTSSLLLLAEQYGEIYRLDLLGASGKYLWGYWVPNALPLFYRATARRRQQLQPPQRAVRRQTLSQAFHRGCKGDRRLRARRALHVRRARTVLTSSYPLTFIQGRHDGQKLGDRPYVRPPCHYYNIG